MLKPCFEMSSDEALAFAGQVGMFHVAAATPRGPRIHTVDGVVHQGSLCFHGGDHGGKLGLLDREVVVSAEQLVAHLPSWFFDERRACPATTFYRSVHVQGRAERVEAPEQKAAILRALMRRYQPEGRYVEIEADAPLYAKAVHKLLVVKIRPTSITGKAKLGQHQGARTIGRVLDQLWRRGEPGDLRALRLIRHAHPARPARPWMQGPSGIVFEVAPDAREVEAAVRLVSGEYWNEGVEISRVRLAHLASTAWVVAKDPAGTVVATARATSDGAKAAMIFDVAVAPEHRGQGLGQALMSTLLDHPRIRAVRSVTLATRDAQAFYAKLGFGPHEPRHSVLSLRRTSPAVTAALPRSPP